MTVDFYVGRNNKRFGPYSAAQLRELATSARLRPTDTLWKEGMESPVLLSKVKNLFPSLTITNDSAPKVASSSLTTVSEMQSVNSSGEGLSEASPVLSAAGEIPSDPGMVPLSSSPWTDLTETDEPAQAVASEKPAVKEPEKVVTRRAVGIRGAIILGQDGHSVHFRKKCTQCSHEDTCRSTMLIGNGLTRTHFFCPKCRKSREVQIQGMRQ